MGIDCCFHIGFGYTVNAEDVYSKYRITFPEESHMEDRFDPKTGRLVGQEKVIDEFETTTYTFDSRHCEEEEDLEGALADHLDCDVRVHGDTMFFTVNVKQTGEDEFAVDDAVTTGSVLFKDVKGLDSKLKKLADRMKKLGIKPGKAKVFVVPSVG